MYNLGPATIVLKLAPKRQPKTEETDIFENIRNNSTISENFNTFLTTVSSKYVIKKKNFCVYIKYIRRKRVNNYIS